MKHKISPKIDKITLSQPAKLTAVGFCGSPFWGLRPPPPTAPKGDGQRLKQTPAHHLDSQFSTSYVPAVLAFLFARGTYVNWIFPWPKIRAAILRECPLQESIFYLSYSNGFSTRLSAPHLHRNHYQHTSFLSKIENKMRVRCEWCIRVKEGFPQVKNVSPNFKKRRMSRPVNFPKSKCSAVSEKGSKKEEW